MVVERLAPAKVNLFLHVGAPAADGYHDLATLMVFADIGDKVRVEVGGAGFSVTGPFSGALSGGGDNLVIVARDAFISRFGNRGPIGLILEKRLPIAAGLGGGSADAAATLLLMAEVWNLDEAARTGAGGLGVLARALGADVAACLASTAVWATGRGDRLSPVEGLPSLPAVLVNPLAPCSTGAVYSAFDEGAAWGDLTAAAAPVGLNVSVTIDWLRGTRNDLQDASIQVQPAVAEVLAALEAASEPLLTRMSGSGATCFALCADDAARDRLAGKLTDAHPTWWVQPCRLG